MAKPPGDNLLNHLTDAQRLAATTVDRSLLVTAAAGSGKTTVLAERCAAVVCDVEGDRRCRVDELLVVTFTKAAAEEMRTRIGAAIRKRLDRQPTSTYLREQLYLLDNASISTIHAFCQTIIQRWFPQAGVDPQASVLAGDEAELLKHEVLDALFIEQYVGGDGAIAGFQALVDDYGDGVDKRLVPVVLDIHRFARSLPDPDGWLAESLGHLDVENHEGLSTRLDAIQQWRLKREIALQMHYCREQTETIRQCWPIAEMHAETFDEQLAYLNQWHSMLSESDPTAWEQVAAAIREHKFPAKRRPNKLSDEDKATYDAAKAVSDRMKDLFKARLYKAMALFTGDEYRDGLRRIAPHVRALVDLVRAFDHRYRTTKSAQAAMDFEDLQRHAYLLLAENGDDRRPSEVARQLQRQYRYVAVDEYQDVDPLQAAILRLVSRESADPPEGNLFSVGDIKQSIYRFRLAEPQLFTDRLKEFSVAGALGQVIHLRENFRSRDSVIEAINLVFRPLMRAAFGGSDYDETAELKAGMTYPQAGDVLAFDRPAVELHLLEPITAQTAVADDDGDDSGGSSGEGSGASTDDLEGIEREAFLIGRRIQQWMGDNPRKQRWHVADRPATPGGPPVMRPIEYRDVVVLLRALPFKSEPIAEVLRRMGIPVRIESGGEQMDSVEIKDAISLLRVLDNRRQDIPLAAVLRSPLLRERFNESDLLEARLLDRDVPFHEAVDRYTREGADTGLRQRLADALALLGRWRERIHREPVAQVLWEIYEETDYLGYVQGLPGGRRRYEHLVQFHELAREFGHFARQGLRRFLRFVDEIVSQERPVQPAGTTGVDDNVVRIMSIHHSKGLEFPVVVLADLQKRFNLQDARSPILIDRRFGIGVKAVDAERRVRYPTLIHQLAAERVHHESLSEELRILYVALTRAREHLVLVGRLSPERASMWQRRQQANAGLGGHVSQLTMATASNPLDWLMPAICLAPTDTVEWHETEAKDVAKTTAGLLKIYTHSRSTTDRWQFPTMIETDRAVELARLAELQSPPADEPIAADEEVEPVLAALAHVYSATELTTLPARIGVSELKRRWDAMMDPEQRKPAMKPRVAGQKKKLLVGEPSTESAAGRGTATHRFLQLLDLRRPCDLPDLEAQRRGLIEQGRLTAEDAGQVMIDSTAWFLDTLLGRQIRKRADDVLREVAFVSRVSPERIDSLLRARDERDVVLVRGMIDLVLRGPADLDLLDYKTDAVEADQCREWAEQYRGQIETYAEALAGVYRRPVGHRWLVFLQPREIIELSAS